MDEDRFDRIARWLGEAVDRRAGLRGLAAVAVATITGAAAQPGAAKRTTRHRRPKTEGPCGNGRAKANACERDEQCCTGYCHKRKGRCRCKKVCRSCAEHASPRHP